MRIKGSKVYWHARFEAQQQIAEHFESELRIARERIAELEDAARAQTLAELRTFRPVAMPIPDEPDDAREFGTDPTGLLIEPLPPLTAAEQRIADQVALGNG